MINCFFVSDLHGRLDRYNKLLDLIEKEKPQILFMGGDLLPSGTAAFSKSSNTMHNFINDFLIVEFEKLRSKLGKDYPEIYIILGNDDARAEEADLITASQNGLWHYANMNKFQFNDYTIIGYSFVPPTPFQLKDWEKYDVSRYVDPGCVSPEEGRRTVAVEEREIKYGSIKSDLELLIKDIPLDKTIFLFHSPPYKTNLDRAALDGKIFEHVPLDVHVGSIAIQRMIEKEQPYITLHGHVHESTRLTGKWSEIIGATHSFNAAHDGSELCIVKFDLEDPKSAVRILY